MRSDDGVEVDYYNAEQKGCDDRPGNEVWTGLRQTEPRKIRFHLTPQNDFIDDVLADIQDYACQKTTEKNSCNVDFHFSSVVSRGTNLSREWALSIDFAGAGLVLARPLGSCSVWRRYSST